MSMIAMFYMHYQCIAQPRPYVLIAPQKVDNITFGKIKKEFDIVNNRQSELRNKFNGPTLFFTYTNEKDIYNFISKSFSDDIKENIYTNDFENMDKHDKKWITVPNEMRKDLFVNKTSFIGDICYLGLDDIPLEIGKLIYKFNSNGKSAIYY